MQLELTELLVCPRCGPPHGLIAFVERMESRRIDAGHLDCPICEERHAIIGGTVWFGVASPSPGEAGCRTSAPPGDAPADAAAATAAALLGAPAGSETLLFGPGAVTLASPAADLRADARVISFGAAPSPAHGRVHSLVLHGGGDVPVGLPLRDRSLDGVVLRGDPIAWLTEAARVLRTGARFVVLDPGAETVFPQDTPLQILAADPRAWVAVRS